MVLFKNVVPTSFRDCFLKCDYYTHFLNYDWWGYKASSTMYSFWNQLFYSTNSKGMTKLQINVLIFTINVRFYDYYHGYILKKNKIMQIFDNLSIINPLAAPFKQICVAIKLRNFLVIIHLFISTFFLTPTSFINGFRQNLDIMTLIDLPWSRLALDVPNSSQLEII
jgi:hypothetical protein